jgi:hypothetical protein
LIVILVLVLVIAAVAVPKAVRMRRFSRAESGVLSIASAFAQYRVDTGQECRRIEDLIDNPGIPGWLGPYIDKENVWNPWGGKYAVKFDERKIGIPKGDKAPDRYEFGGSKEISFDFAFLYSTMSRPSIAAKSES